MPVPALKIEFQVPFTALVSDNERPVRLLKQVGGKRVPVRGRSEKYRMGQALIRAHARRAMAGAPPPQEPLHVQFTFWWPDRRRRDPANLLKQLLDALKGVVFEDDAWVFLPELELVSAGVNNHNPRVLIQARSLQSNQEDR